MSRWPSLVVFTLLALGGESRVRARHLEEGRDYLPFLDLDLPSSYSSDSATPSANDVSNVYRIRKEWVSETLNVNNLFGEQNSIEMFIHDAYGLISFNTSFTFEGKQLDYTRFYYRRFPKCVLAPFSVGGNEYESSDRTISRADYVGYEIHSSNNGTQRSIDLLGRVSSFISNSTFLKSTTNTPQITPFTGTWMVVVHWDKNPKSNYRRTVERVPINTFQAIVITDWARTYSVFSYKCGDLQWTSRDSYSYHPIIGFALPQSNIFTNHPLSNRADSHLISCLNYPDSVWSNVVYQLSPPLSVSMYDSVDFESLNSLSIPNPTTGSCVEAGHTQCCYVNENDFYTCRNYSSNCFCDRYCYVHSDCCEDIEEVCEFNLFQSNPKAAADIAIGVVLGVLFVLLVVFAIVMVALCTCGPLRKIYLKVPAGGVEVDT